MNRTALSAGPANAYVVCNAHECWHTHARYRYREPGLVVHPDDWYFHNRWDEHGPYRWRGDYHRDRGFWRNGVWITF
jgi:hypothetical protein